MCIRDRNSGIDKTDFSLDAKALLARVYSWSMAKFMLESWLPLIQESSPLSSPDSPLHPHLNAILKMTKRYNFTLRVSQVVEMFLSKVGGSEDHFPFSGIQEFMEWSCPGAWLGGIKRCVSVMIEADSDRLWLCLRLTTRWCPEVGVGGDCADPDCLPYVAVESSSHFVLATVPHGGHLGWWDGPLTGPDRHRRWHTRPVVEFFRGLLNDIVYAGDGKMPTLERHIDYDGWSCVEGTRWKVMAEFELS